MADRRAFNQILINLISNAIKFTPRGGHVTVSALCDGPNFAVTVEDNGVGIGEDDLPRLGEAFFQARCVVRPAPRRNRSRPVHRQGPGQLHDGAVDIRSRLGKGTRVTVRLPINCEVRRPGRSRSTSSPSGPKSSRQPPMSSKFSEEKAWSRAGRARAAGRVPPSSSNIRASSSASSWRRWPRFRFSSTRCSCKRARIRRRSCDAADASPRGGVNPAADPGPVQPSAGGRHGAGRTQLIANIQRELNRGLL